ncbi:MAG: hypothetical protein GYB41_00675 [Oceanospirillales bacterium]|nr:hypothetical protein [Oceanospirillales bacterium]
MKKENLTRFDQNFERSEFGRNFCLPSGELVDLHGVRIIDTSIDTVRQLYNGMLNHDVLDGLEERLEAEHRPVVEYHGHLWRLRRGGKAGFKFLLQNAEFGVVILLKNNHTTADRAGSHCKVEISPKLIRDQSPDVLQHQMDELASGWFVVAPSPCGVAIHIATDWQGWTPPSDFVSRLTCRSQRVNDRSGFQSLEVTTGEVASVYGRGQSYTFGTVSSLQAALYNKSKEIIAHDKIDYFHGIWASKLGHDWEPLWNPDQDVWRLEFRFSQTVLRQFAEYNTTQDKKCNLSTYESASEYLANLWAYALDRFRLDHNRRFVDPFWTLLYEEAEWSKPAPDFIAKRQYKTAGIGNEKNVTLALGNLISIYARNNITARKAWSCLKKSGLWRDLMGYIKAREITKTDLFDMIERGLLERRLTSKVAA